jgi:hypothetical protein
MPISGRCEAANHVVSRAGARSKNGHMAMMGESDSWPLKVLALVFGDQSIKLLAALCVAKDLVRGHAYS